MPKTNHRIYVAGPAYNSAERAELNRIAAVLKRAGFLTYLPHRDGLKESKVVAQLQSEGRSLEAAQTEASNLIFQFNVYNLMKARAVVVDANFAELDAGVVSLTSIAFSTCMPVIMYRDDSRTFSASSEVNPIFSALKTVPFVRTIAAIPAAVRASFSKLDAKCISESIRSIMIAGSRINRGRFN